MKVQVKTFTGKVARKVLRKCLPFALAVMSGLVAVTLTSGCSAVTEFPSKVHDGWVNSDVPAEKREESDKNAEEQKCEWGNCDTPPEPTGDSPPEPSEAPEPVEEPAPMPTDADGNPIE